MCVIVFHTIFLPTDHGKAVTTDLYNDKNFFEVYRVWLNFITQFVIPLIVLIVLNSLLFREVKYSISTVPGVVALGQQVQRLRDPAQLGVDCLGRDVQDAAVAHSCHTDHNNYLLQNLCLLTHIS